MMNEVLIRENNIHTYNYRYYLIESYNTKIKKYGVRIDKHNNQNIIVDSKCIHNIFDNKEKTIKAIRIISKLQVTPITLEDVVIDNIYSR